MSDSGQRRWKILSLVLLSALAISLIVNVYSMLFRSSTEPEAPLQFTFTWGPNSQKIVNGTFVLSIKMWINGENVTLIANANDDDYNDSDYLGLVFDTNHNGYIDHYDIGAPDSGLSADHSYLLCADNRTVESDLLAHGFLGFPELLPIPGPQNVTFDAISGYTFRVEFPYYYYYANTYWSPGQAIRNGTNQIHVCFWDYALFGWSNPPGVFTRFTFTV